MRRLTILLAAVGALLLVPAAQALANGTITIGAEGNGSGEVVGAEGEFGGNPPLACKYTSPGPATGTCSTELGGEPGFEGIEMSAVPAPGSEFGGWVKKDPSFEVHSGGGCPNSSEYPPLPIFCAGYEFEAEEPAWEATAIFCTESTAIIVDEVIDHAHYLKFEGCEEPENPNLKLIFEEGSGAVVSNPSGLECSKSAPKSCIGEVAEGKVTLTASPAPGYLVKSWKGCDAGGVNGRQCTVTAGSSLKTVGVKFYKVFKLQGSKTGQGIMGTSPGGINCGYACTSSTALYKEGGLTIKAKPAKHFHFVEFTGGAGSAASCNGVTTPECTIATFNSDSAIKEVYAEDAKNTLSLTKEGGGQGFVKTTPSNINCGYTCTAAAAQFYASESAAITVTLNKGTTSVTWTSGAGTCTGNALTCTVPMSETHSLVAKFE